jgi:RNA polymerase primary sigma factor
VTRARSGNCGRSRSKPLTFEEERNLLERTRTGDLHARGRIALSHSGIIRKIALRYGRFGLPLDDLIQEGYLAVFHAIELFQPHGTTRLITYATWWIRHYMCRAIASQRGPLSLPVHFLSAANGCAGQFHGDGTKCAATQTRTLCSVSGEILSGNSHGHEVSPEQLADVGQPTPLDNITANSLHSAVRNGIAKLSPAEAQVIRLRYGLDGSMPMTLESIGRKRGISRESVRIMEQAALRKLRVLL